MRCSHCEHIFSISLDAARTEVVVTDIKIPFKTVMNVTVAFAISGAIVGILFWIFAQMLIIIMAGSD